MQPQQQTEEKKLILMRGVSGSGKSYKAKQLAKTNPKSVVYSTDDFFEVNGKYEFDGSKIGQYHQKNQDRTYQALKDGVPLVIIDNTNIRLWEMTKYVEMAQQFGYKVDVQTSETDWAWNAEICAQKNSHGVPADKIQGMIDRYEKFTSIDDILKAEPPAPRKPKHK